MHKLITINYINNKQEKLKLQIKKYFQNISIKQINKKKSNKQIN